MVALWDNASFSATPLMAVPDQASQPDLVAPVIVPTVMPHTTFYLTLNGYTLKWRAASMSREASVYEDERVFCEIWRCMADVFDDARRDLCEQ